MSEFNQTEPYYLRLERSYVDLQGTQDPKKKETLEYLQCLAEMTLELKGWIVKEAQEKFGLSEEEALFAFENTQPCCITACWVKQGSHELHYDPVRKKLYSDWKKD